MSARLLDRPIRIAIREIRVEAVSALEARRLADALPAALDRAFVRLTEGKVGVAAVRNPADRVAAQIADAVAVQIEVAR